MKGVTTHKSSDIWSRSGHGCCELSDIKSRSGQECHELSDSWSGQGCRESRDIWSGIGHGWHATRDQYLGASNEEFK